MPTLSPGTRLGPYEITAKLGEGGMGVVFRAKDFHLGREVALKVLPEGFASDPERLARFEREAKLLAQLNHPNIAQVHGLEVSGDTRALVMELVEGPTLAERLERGALPLDESLSIARQIAEALEEAHEKGIIHRDLKPQNVKASVEGKVKILDFGLAKAFDPRPVSGASASELAHSPTITLGGTREGVILGTAAYMSPEQARGLAVDKRTDIWAFGVVLDEMLTGRAAFAAATVPDTLAAVLTREIDWELLPPSTPSAIRRLLRRCLERNPKNRLHDIADARIVLEDVVSGRSDVEVATVSPTARRPVRGLVFSVALATLAIVVGWLLGRSPQPVDRSLSRFSIQLPPEMPYRVASRPGCSIAIARDGSRFAYTYAREDLDGPKLFVRKLDELAPRPVAGTETGARQPFFSPDGE